MNISEEEVRYVAALANLKLSDEEAPRFARDLGEILSHISRLNEVDTTGVEPMAQVLFAASDTATLREDVERAPLTNEEALANSALAGGGYFKVPLVIER